MTYRWDSQHMLCMISRDWQQYEFDSVMGDADGPNWWLRADLDGRWSAIAHLDYPARPDRWLILAGHSLNCTIHVVHQQTVTGINDAHWVWLTWLLGRCDIGRAGEKTTSIENRSGFDRPLSVDESSCK